MKTRRIEKLAGRRGLLRPVVRLFVCGLLLVPAGASAQTIQMNPKYRPLTGMLSMEAYALSSPGIDPLSSLGYHIITHYTPAAGSRWSFDLNVRNQHYLTSGRTSRRFIYDAKANFQSGGLAFSGGRMSIYDVGSIGTVDGARVTYTTGSLTVGGYGGYVPNYITAGFSRDLLTLGGSLTYQSSNGSRSDLALTDVRHQGLTERRFLSVQNFLYLGPGSSVFQCLEYELGPNIPGANRLSRLMVSGSATASPDLSISGSFSFGRSIDYLRLLAESSDTSILTDPSVIGSFYYENFMMNARYRLTDRIRLIGGLSLFKRSQTSGLSKQFRMGVSGLELAGTSISGSYARALDAGSGRGVITLSAARDLGIVTCEFNYSNYGDTLVLTDLGSALHFTPIPGYQIFGGSAFVRISGPLSLSADLQRASGAGNDYTTFYLRAIYRFL